MNNSSETLRIPASWISRIFFFISICHHCVTWAASRPNIVFVLVDDHAFEAVSAYGSHLKDYAKTPTIDSLGKQGMRFDNFVCVNSNRNFKSKYKKLNSPALTGRKTEFSRWTRNQRRCALLMPYTRIAFSRMPFITAESPLVERNSLTMRTTSSTLPKWADTPQLVAKMTRSSPKASKQVFRIGR